MEFQPRARRIDPAEPLTDDHAKYISDGFCHDLSVVMACCHGIVETPGWNYNVGTESRPPVRAQMVF
jgi:hypothetical protein